MESGVQYVKMVGMLLMLMWCVVNWDIQELVSQLMNI